jgi:hypothetical protein
MNGKGNLLHTGIRLPHEIRVLVMTETYGYFVIAHCSLINMLTCDEMGESGREHGWIWVLIIPMKLWFGVEDRSVYRVCSRGSKELFAAAVVFTWQGSERSEMFLEE